MSVPAAFLGVVLIWSTTPLAIQWSSAGWGYLFGISGRMLLGAAVCAVLLQIFKPGLPWHREARNTYFVAGIAIYGAMLSVYWGAQFIPSGLIAVLFGLNPLLTGVMAALLLGEKSFTPGKVLGMGLAFGGLASIFADDLLRDNHAWHGVLAVLFSVILHSMSSVWLKRIGGGLPGLTVTSGGLFVVAPLFVLTWWIFDGELPTTVSAQAGWSLLYLGVFGSALGFTLYFYLIRKMQANRVSLITLLTPVLALLLGNMLNGEQVSLEVLLGSGLILSGLLLHLWGDRWVARLLPGRLSL
ncbi:MAG TPA: DMT family transporter [Gammaproteobacteria bacterium]|nr:DMT family transporter [Gammaproteobacteria bacterium]